VESHRQPLLAVNGMVVRQKEMQGLALGDELEERIGALKASATDAHLDGVHT
jgi:hypothetical protein